MSDGSPPRISVETTRCSLCLKLPGEAEYIVNARTVDVCDECVDQLNGVLEEQLPSWNWRRTSERVIRKRQWKPPRVVPEEGKDNHTAIAIPPEVDDELRSLWTAVVQTDGNDYDAIRALVEHYQPLMDHYVDRARPHREDLMVHARFAVNWAIFDWDPTGDKPFETFAVRLIRESVYRGIFYALGPGEHSRRPTTGAAPDE